MGEAEHAVPETIREIYRMRAIGIVGETDDQHKIHAEAPHELPPGRVHLIVVRPDEEEAGAFWPWDVSQTWSDELGDMLPDFYTLADGQPVDALRCGLPGEVAQASPNSYRYTGLLWNPD